MTGFTDAEGSFSIVKIKNNNFKFFFRIRLHKDDINVLQEISKMLNVTSPFLDKNSAVLQITKLTDIINIIIPIFNEIPLLTIKSLQFNIFKEAVYIKHNSKSKKESTLSDIDYKNIFELKNRMKNVMNLENKKYIQQTRIDNNSFITPYWLLGFVEGEGTFGYRSLVPYFQICQHSRDVYVLDQIKIFLESLREKSVSTNTNNTEIIPVVTKIYNKKTDKKSFFFLRLGSLMVEALI